MTGYEVDLRLGRHTMKAVAHLTALRPGVKAMGVEGLLEELGARIHKS